MASASGTLTLLMYPVVRKRQKSGKRAEINWIVISGILNPNNAPTTEIGVALLATRSQRFFGRDKLSCPANRLGEIWSLLTNCIPRIETGTGRILKAGLSKIEESLPGTPNPF